MKLIRFAALAALVALAQGCAFTKATLDLHANQDAKVAGPLGDVKSIRFTAPALDDARLDKARIGWKKNGFGQQTADITSKEPVDQVVEKAVAKALTDTKHNVGNSGGVEVVGTVDRFWFDYDVNMWTVKFIGDVQCTLDFVDAQTRQSIYKSKYSGSHSETKAGGLEATWTLVLNKSLDKLIESVVLDDELTAALNARLAQQPSIAATE